MVLQQSFHFNVLILLLSVSFDMLLNLVLRALSYGPQRILRMVGYYYVACVCGQLFRYVHGRIVSVPQQSTNGSLVIHHSFQLGRWVSD